MTTEERKSLLARRDPIVWVVLGISLLGLLLICVFGYLLLGGNGDGETVTETDGTAAPPFSQTTPIASGPQIALEAAVGGSAPISLTLDAPVFLEIGGQTLPITARYIAPEAIWEPFSTADDTAVWVYGTIVNYTFGLPGSEANAALLEELVQGDPIVVRTKSQAEYSFTFTGSEMMGSPTAELFSQNRPAITLVWLGEAENNQRLIVRGDYVVAENSLPSTTNEFVCELGENCQLGNTSLTVSGATHAVDRPEAPPGFALYLVDFAIENLGTTPLDTGLLRFVLIDDSGNQYSLNALASQLGSYPLLTGIINAGESKTVTAGYQIPAGLSSTTLRWVVSRVDSPSQMEVQIPFTGNRAQNVLVTLQQADVSADGTSLNIVGQVTNLGQQPVIITEADLSLKGDNTVYLLTTTNPGFPWSIPAGQVTNFVLSYQRPQAASAVFQLLNQSFQLTGLR
ncbi:MAG: DUF4352 domain-containing protein [Chloroflexi bacterium]|nr:DUF4352 domain-containing protein [Chloroflexota bacterium]